MMVERSDINNRDLPLRSTGWSRGSELTWWRRAEIYRSKTKHETCKRGNRKKSSSGFVGIGYEKMLESENGALYLNKIGAGRISLEIRPTT
jgi:hypothetical protein